VPKYSLCGRLWPRFPWREKYAQSFLPVFTILKISTQKNASKTDLCTMDSQIQAQNPSIWPCSSLCQPVNIIEDCIYTLLLIFWVLGKKRSHTSRFLTQIPDLSARSLLSPSTLRRLNLGILDGLFPAMLRWESTTLHKVVPRFPALPSDENPRPSCLDLADAVY